MEMKNLSGGFLFHAVSFLCGYLWINISYIFLYVNMYIIIIK